MQLLVSITRHHGNVKNASHQFVCKIEKENEERGKLAEVSIVIEMMQF